MFTRRSFLSAGGLALAGLAAPEARAASRLLAGFGGGPGFSGRGSGLGGPGFGGRVVEIRMRSDARGTRVWFDPIGVMVEPGTTVRWILAESVHSTTAYHPANANHSLRIPDGAEPWDSGILTKPGSEFEVKLTVAGTYDYYCTPHEMAGMVGRIVVRAPDGVAPGALAFDYFEGRPGTGEWRAVPEAARRAFPPVDEIVRRGIVRREESQPASTERT